MPRLVPFAIQEILDSNSGETHDTVDIILPLKPGETEADRISYFLSSASGINYNGNTYQPMLRGIGTIKFSLGSAPDQSEVNIENLSRTFGATISDRARPLDGAKVIIRRAFKLSNGTYQAVDLFHGYVRDVTVSEEIVKLSIVSDLSRRGSQVASRGLSQRCIWTFRGPECGWTPDQPGDPTFCNKVFADAAGCAGHANQVRFGGVPTLNPAVREILDLPDDPDGTLGPGSGYGDADRPLPRRRFDRDFGNGFGELMPVQDIV